MTQQNLPNIPPPPERDPVDVEREALVKEWLLTQPGADSLSGIQRHEVLNIVKGMRAKDVANAENARPDTVRTRRKHIYRKLDLDGAQELMSFVLAHALQKLVRPK
jgi:DNA-binding CsgD family transcriptional regulator